MLLPLPLLLLLLVSVRSLCLLRAPATARPRLCLGSGLLQGRRLARLR